MLSLLESTELAACQWPFDRRRLIFPYPGEGAEKEILSLCTRRVTALSLSLPLTHSTQRDWKSSSSSRKGGMHKNRFWESRHIWPNRATIFAFHLRIPQVLNLSGKHFQNKKEIKRIDAWFSRLSERYQNYERNYMYPSYAMTQI